MRKFLPFGVVALLLVAFTVYAQGQQTQTWKGWISDSSCAAKGTSAQHKECAIKCVKEKGASWVFVSLPAKDVLKIHNQDVVNPDADLDQEVQVSGHITDDGSLHVDSISPIK
jgi:hypothetical protein